MRRSIVTVLTVVLVGLFAVPGGAVAPFDDGVIDSGDEAHENHQHGGEDGHIPASSLNVQVESKLRVSGAAEGRIADVFGFGDYAYLAAYSDPSCQRGGVYVVDISDPSAPREVSFIPTPGGSYVGEGVQVIHVDTAKFTGDVLIHNNEICGTSGVGGVSLWDVTNPVRPKMLARGVGDFTDEDGSILKTAHEVHSAFAWDAGPNAYAIMVDDEEALDVDILDITDPTRPKLIKETGLPDWPGAQNEQSEGMGAFAASFHHDLQVRRFGTNWLALLSYWDAGWIVLDVTNPAAPKFVNDTDYAATDPVTGVTPPEGNAHQAWWSADGKYFIGTDEDFSPVRVTATITSGPFAGTTFDAAQGDQVPQINDQNSLVGSTRFVGQACSSVPAAAVGTIAVIERGTCTFTEKVTNAQSAGYAGAIIFNSTNGDPPCEALVSPLIAADIPAVFVARSTGYEILGITGYDPAACPSGTNPALPAIGTAGASVDMSGFFDGWGYVHLFDAKTLRAIDTYTIPQTADPEFAEGHGDVSVHEVETDDTTNLAYFSWYTGGFRVARFDRTGITEVGHYIDPAGSNLWGIDPHVDANGDTIILASDRDSGLWIFRYTGP